LQAGIENTKWFTPISADRACAGCTHETLAERPDEQKNHQPQLLMALMVKANNAFQTAQRKDVFMG
jgi:hypothetical protein